MELRVGWATDFGREKFDISMDSMNDLPRILSEAGIPPERNAELTAGEVFALLEITCRWYAAHEQRRIPGTNPAERGAEIAMLNGERQQIVASVKARLGIADEQPAAVPA